MIRSRSGGLVGRKHADVVADAEVGRLIDEAGIAADAALREHLVEHHGIDAAQRQIAVRMHVVLVGHRRRRRARACAATSRS